MVIWKRQPLWGCLCLKKKKIVVWFFYYIDAGVGEERVELKVVCMFACKGYSIVLKSVGCTYKVFIGINSLFVQPGTRL